MLADLLPDRVLQHSPGPLRVSPAAPAFPFTPTARSERYRHLGSEDDETNDEESSTEIPQFSSCSHRFSKVGLGSRNLCS